MTLNRDIRYLLVDEYQDTNTVQEQLLLNLTEHSGNPCTVGDEECTEANGFGAPR